MIGIVLSITSFVFILFSAYVGKLASKYGTRRITIYALWFSIFIPILYANSSNIFQYMGAKVGYGLTAIILGPIMFSLMQGCLSGRKDTGKMSGFYFSAQAIGGSVASFLGGYTAENFGLTAPYYVMAAFIFLALLSIYFIKEPEKKTRKTNKTISILSALKYVFNEPKLVFTLLMSMGFSLHWGMRSIVFPLMIYSMTGSDLNTGIVFSAMGFAAMFLLPLTGHIIDKKGFFFSGIIGLILLGTFSLGMAMSDTFYMLLIMSILFTVGESFNGPLLSYMDIKVIPEEKRPTIVASRATLFALMVLISPILAGFMLRYLNYQWVLITFSVFFWLILLINVILYKTKIQK